VGWFRSSTSSGSGEAARPRTLEERLAAIEPGVPGRCPACDGLGYIDDLDLGQRYQIQHCKDCSHRWEYLFDDQGHVVGLTELDGAGQPVARMRVRRPEVLAERAAAEVAPAVLAPAAGPPDDDVVIDLRPSPAAQEDEVIDLAGPGTPDPDRMSPAEWLRHSLRR